MKKFIFFFGWIAICGSYTNASAQNAEDIITESSVPESNYYIDDIIQRRLVEENRVLEYEPIREADVAWEKRIWRIIDTREKINLPFRYPEKPLFTIFKDMVENGDIKVFKDEKFKEQMTVTEINSTLSRVDTIVVYNDDTYEEEIKIVKNDVNPSDIKRYRLKEMWYFDEETSVFKVRLLGIAPIKDEFDLETGEFKYESPLFWVYYPEARNYLSSHRVFNEFNDIAPMTWQDLFEARFFASYIIKKSNPLDLRLKDIYPDNGIDLLMESERIKQELFNFEHDLWEY
jgi:gliding motility associated protien GldN